MSATEDSKEPRDFEDKDEKCSRSTGNDEENALQSGEKQDDESPNAKDVEQSAAKNEDVIPNGGTQAWLQVLGSFMLFFNTFGILKYVYIWAHGSALSHDFNQEGDG